MEEARSEPSKEGERRDSSGEGEGAEGSERGRGRGHGHGRVPRSRV